MNKTQITGGLEMLCLYKDATVGGLAKAGLREPLFVLRAQDLVAPEAVEAWIGLARQAGAPEEKLAHAQLHADVMRAWSGPKKVPD